MSSFSSMFRFRLARWDCLFYAWLFCSQAILLSPASAQPAAEWPMSRGDAAGTGATQESLPAQPKLLWEFENEGLGYDAGPIVAEGTVFAADADGEVLALNLATGKSLWKKQFDSGYMASPAFRNGQLLVGDVNGKLRALDAKSGEELWSFDAEQEIDGCPNFYEDSVLFTSQSGVLYALHLADGKLKWKYETGDQLQCGATLAGMRTFLGGCDSNLHVIDVVNGQSVGELLPIDAPTGSTPSVYKDLVLVPTYAGEILAFKHATGELAWRFKNEDLASEFKNSVAVADGLLIATSRNRRVFALEVPTGKLAWQQTLRKRSDASPVIAADKIVLAAADGRILLLDLKTGEEKWLFEVKGGFLGSPAVANGKLVVASDRGTIYCFGAQP